jgi:hypothetical protein
VCCVRAVEHAAELSGGAVADGADLRGGLGPERRGGARGVARRQEPVGHRLRHAPLHRRLLRTYSLSSLMKNDRFHDRANI